jgi:hypothetical protein
MMLLAPACPKVRGEASEPKKEGKIPVPRSQNPSPRFAEFSWPALQMMNLFHHTIFHVASVNRRRQIHQRRTPNERH